MAFFLSNQGGSPCVSVTEDWAVSGQKVKGDEGQEASLGLATRRFVALLLFQQNCEGERGPLSMVTG